MNSLIKETNDNLKAIIDTMKGNLDSSINSLENIQMQMDKKVEEAKKYKIQVDSSKEIIKDLEADNKSLELSLKELNDKYSKMNLVSVIEAGNREIKAKINDNVREINKQKEHIAELTSKARTIKDLLMNLKKDKTAKEDRLESLKVVYEYYSTRINDVIDYAFNHSENLVDFRDVSFYDKNINFDENVEVDSKDLDNTMLFDEIANIDNNKNFKDEMSFISDQIDKNIDYKTLEEEENSDESSENFVVDESDGGFDIDFNESLSDNLNKELDEDFIDTTQMFNEIINEPVSEVEETKEAEPMTLEEAIDKKYAELTESENSVDNSIEENNVNSDLEIDISKEMEALNSFLDEDISQDNETNSIGETVETNDVLPTNEEKIEIIEEIPDNVLVGNESLPSIEENVESKEPLNAQTMEDAYLDEQNEERLSKINNLFSTLDSIDINAPEVTPLNASVGVETLENQIDNVFQDTFGQSINEQTSMDATMTDIFGNPITNEDVTQDTVSKKIEELR